jgi:hypothetical protein
MFGNRKRHGRRAPVPNETLIALLLQEGAEANARADYHAAERQRLATEFADPYARQGDWHNGRYDVDDPDDDW